MPLKCLPSCNMHIEMRNTTNYKHNCSAPLLAVCVDRKFHLKKLCLQNETRFPEPPTHTRLRFATGFATPRNYQMSTAFTRHGTYYGRLPWAKLFEPTIKLCTEGWRVSDSMAKAIEIEEEAIRSDKYLSADIQKCSADIQKTVQTCDLGAPL